MTPDMAMTVDAHILATLHARCFPRGWTLESFEKLLASEGVQVRVIAEKSFLLTRMVADEMEVLTIAVSPEERRQGMASRLMRDALQYAVSRGVQKCFLEVDQHNMAAIRCYENLGFSVISVRKNYYVSPEGQSDALLMQCVLYQGNEVS